MIDLDLTIPEFLRVLPGERRKPRRSPRPRFKITPPDEECWSFIVLEVKRFDLHLYDEVPGIPAGQRQAWVHFGSKQVGIQAGENRAVIPLKAWEALGRSVTLLDTP